MREAEKLKPTKWKVGFFRVSLRFTVLSMGLF